MAEMIVRLETKDGFKSYAVNTDIMQVRGAVVYKQILDVLPDMIRMPLNAAMFALRHGPIQKLLREKNLPEMCKDCDKDAEAIKALFRIYFSAVETAQHEAGTTTLDMMQSDLFSNNEGLIRRAPEYDALPSIFKKSEEERVDGGNLHETLQELNPPVTRVAGFA